MTAPERLQHWQACPHPDGRVLSGRYTRLESLQAAHHAEQLFEASSRGDAEARFRYLFETPPTRTELQAWVERVQPDPLACPAPDPWFYAVIDQQTGRCEGRQALMRITPAHGVIEVGSILWGDAITRSRVTTEAIYLFAQHVFDDLGYRRFEWKCHADNHPSRRAALRFGFQFEGIFRQHMVFKGGNRDTAWFAMTDQDWPKLKARYQAWLAPENFDEAGRQRVGLGEF